MLLTADCDGGRLSTRNCPLHSAPITDGTNTLARLRAVGKDYAAMGSSVSRLRTIYDLIRGRPAKSYYRALTDIDLTIARGESWGIVGENGAGKSTLLKIIAGVVKPSQGQLELSGRVGALLELGTGFHPEYSGMENIFLASSLMGWTRAETRARLEEILEFADIGDHIEQPVKTYSSGMVVRLGFAAATALRPDLLVTDEVLAVGDESFQKKCLRWMEEYLASGGTLLLCSHSMYHIQTLCQKAIWIHHGSARMQGDVHTVTRAYLAYHEEKNRKEITRESQSHISSPHPRMEMLWIEDAEGRHCSEFDMNDDIALCGVYFAPDDQPGVVMAGAMRIDGTPVFGSFSNDENFMPNRLGEKRFAFRFQVHRNPLLPGKYRLKAHTLDQHGLRLFDTMEVDMTISGKTREHGLVRLDHSWRAGSLPPPPKT
jgi:lipopolysaccharide transport system ATP-binding protein